MTTGPDFRQTYLWRQAFETPRSDALPGEQEYFRNQYLLLRDKDEQLVHRLAVDLSGMPVHHVTHLATLWDTAPLVEDGAVSVNTAEHFVLGACILLHSASQCMGPNTTG